MVRMHSSAMQYDMFQVYASLSHDGRKRRTFGRLYMLFLFFYKDYFTWKVVNRFMSDGKKLRSITTVHLALYYMKRTVGFQPFSYFKNVVFGMRQLFKLRSVTVRGKTTYIPHVLAPHNQIGYGVNHVIYGTEQILMGGAKLTLPGSSCVVLLNSVSNITPFRRRIRSIWA